MEPVLYHGYEQIGTTVGGREAIIVKPNVTPNGKWALKTEYFDAFPSVQLSLLAKGYHLAYVKNVTRWYYPADTDAHLALANHMRDGWGLSEKCVIIGMSCGGMKGIYFASQYPERVSCLYLDAPVVNLLSCPFGLGRANCAHLRSEFVKVLGKDLSDFLAFRDHPLDRIPRLTANEIPLVLVSGDSDSTVPFEENGIHLKEAYEKAGCDFALHIKAGGEHHPHSLEDNTPILDFIVNH